MNVMHLVWWLIGAVGLSGAIAIVVGLVFGWPVLVGTKLGRMLLMIGTVGISVAVLLARARREGATAEREKQERDNADFEQRVDAHDVELGRLSDAELDSRLRDNSGNAGPR